MTKMVWKDIEYETGDIISFTQGKETRVGVICFGEYTEIVDEPSCFYETKHFGFYVDYGNNSHDTLLDVILWGGNIIPKK